MRTLENTLALWVSGLLSSEEVVAWAGKEVARLKEPPTELFDLLTDGPEKCLKRAEFEFPPRPQRLSYEQAFSVRALSVDLNLEQSVWQFADWAARSCIGEDLSNPVVQFGYQLDHYLDDCQDKEGAKTLVREGLPSLLEHCKAIAAPYAETEA